MKLILYGAGKRCIQLCKKIKNSKYEICSIVDSNSMKWGQTIEGYSVKSPNEISFKESIRVCITVADYLIKNEIRLFLQNKYGVDIVQEIEYEEIEYNLCEDNERIKTILKSYTKSDIETNIIFDCYNIGLGMGGTEAWTKDVCCEFIRNKRRNAYIVSKQGNYKISQILQRNIIYAQHWSIELYSILAIEELVNIIVKKLPCKVITSQIGNFMIAAEIVKAHFPKDIEIISVIHLGKEEAYIEYTNKKKVTDIFLGVSQDICKKMIARGVEKNKIFSMTCPFMCDKEIVRSYSLSLLEPIHIGYAGRIEIEQKRIDLLLECISLLVKKKVNFYIEIAGDGSQMQFMKQYIDNNYLNDKVSFLGQIERSEIHYFWKKQDICINIADYEGRCISKLEAMANGAIPIVTETDGMREDITDGVNGYLVPIGDYKLMAKRIEYLAKNRELLNKMGQLAHDIVYPKSLMSEHISFLGKILFDKD